MTARELYTAARTMFPHAGSIIADHAVQTVKEGASEVWMVSVSSDGPGETDKESAHNIASALGRTPEECLRKLREDGERRANLHKEEGR